MGRRRCDDERTRSAGRDDGEDDDGREEDDNPIGDTLSLLMFPSITIILYGRLRAEGGVWDDATVTTTTGERRTTT